MLTSLIIFKGMLYILGYSQSVFRLIDLFKAL